MTDRETDGIATAYARLAHMLSRAKINICCKQCLTRCVAVPSLMAARLGGSELRSHFLPFVDQSTPNYVCLCGSVCSLQRHFPIDDCLVAFRRRSRSSREVVQNRAEILRFWAIFRLFSRQYYRT